MSALKNLLLNLLLALMLAVVLAGCSKDDNPKADGGALPAEAGGGESGEMETAEDPRAGAKDSLPDNLDFGGKNLRIMHCEEDIWGYEIDIAEEVGDVVKDTIYRRNRAVEDRLNIRIQAMPYAGIYTKPLEFFDYVKRSVKSGSGELDLVAGYGFLSTALGTEGYYLNWHEVGYVDLDRPWWSADFREQMTYDGKMYFLVGDIGITLLSKMFCVYFNKQLASDYDTGNLYQMVLDGDWTLDKMNELSRGVYSDLNGDGKADAGDLYGCAISTGNIIDAMYAAFDYRITQKDADGVPQLSMNSPKMADMVDRVYNFLYNNAGVFSMKEETGGLDVNRKMFTENRVLFLPDMVETNETFRAMNTDYGIIPYPKWDKAQKAYHTSVQLALSMFSIPITCADPDMVGAAAEALCAEGYRKVTPAYFEIALKQKYARDEESSKMLDIIRDGLFFDFGYMNSYSMEGYHNVFRDLMRDKKTDFVSAYEKSEKKYQRALDKVLGSYEKNP